MSLKNPSYEGLYGSNTIKLERDLLHIFPFGTIAEQFKGKIKLHAHPKLIQVFYIESGKTILHTGKFQHEVEGPAFIFVPKSYHHGFEHVRDVKGWIFSISELALAFRFQLDAPLLKWIDELHIKQLSPEDRMTDTFQYIVENCVKEFHANKLGRALMLQTLTYQIIVILSRLEETQSVSITRSQTKAEKLFRQFKQSVKSSYDYRKTVDSYAAELGISVNYLHRVCKEIANRPPKDLIIDFFINESKHLLQDVNKPISQISYQLHFEDPAYYTRIFKKRTGMTPKEFREILFT